MAKVLTDFHVHSDISVDASGTMEQTAQAAGGAGLEQIAFTDHLDLNPIDEGYGKFDPQEVYKIWNSLASRGDKLRIALGVEIGEIHIYQQRQFLTEVYQLPLDVVIGSIHYLGAYGVHANLFDVFPQRQAVNSYFQQALQMVSDADMDVLGHLDYFQRYTHVRGLEC